MMSRLRVLAVSLALLAVVACDSSSPPVTPLPSPVTTTTTTIPVTTWSLTGRVVESSGAPVAGATVEPDGLPAVTTAADGTFTIQRNTPPLSPVQLLAVTTSGFMTRHTYLGWRTTVGGGTDIGLIRDAAPFSLGFYRQLVRNGYETPGTLQILRRWTSAPRFYIRTVDEDTGRTVEPEVVALVQEWLHRAVGMWTGWAIPAVEIGPEARPEQAGWIRVVFMRNVQDYCGRAYVGRNPGEITLALDACDCGSRKVGPDVVVHEVGHAMGFWHVDNPASIMFPYVSGECRVAAVSEIERHHAGVAYQRPFGNTDIDRDPFPFTGFVAPDIRVEN